MARETAAKAAALAISAVTIILCVGFDMPADRVGICSGSPVIHRLTYHFFHVSIPHVLMNDWCLLSVVFLYDISWLTLLGAFLIAASFPADSLSAILPGAFSLPTIGLSGVCYALMGRIAFMTERKIYYQLWLWFYIALGFAFPNVNGWLHLYCYLVGLFIGLINKPLP